MLKEWGEEEDQESCRWCNREWYWVDVSEEDVGDRVFEFRTKVVDLK